MKSFSVRRPRGFRHQEVYSRRRPIRFMSGSRSSARPQHVVVLMVMLFLLLAFCYWLG